jgi:hypothetical protein
MACREIIQGGGANTRPVKVADHVGADITGATDD